MSRTLSTDDIAKKLYSMGKKDHMANYQDNELLQLAARRLWEYQAEVDRLRQTVGELRQRLAEAGAGGEPEPDPEWPPVDGSDGGDMGMDEIRFR